MCLPSSKKKAEVDVSSPFSDFIRNAPSKEKKRVYADVLKKAAEMQNDVIKRVRSASK
ncbi:MAG: hypothetical protein L3J88_08995 [Gammaproteobacteria bacterium]|nr:hypothetical protein [Gammaproteobacteria bacterium]